MPWWTRRGAWRTILAATSWTSSRTPSGRRTGAAATTSRNRSSSRWPPSPTPVPTWIVAGAGTGGTLATLGRFVRYQRHATRICGVDPEHSAFFDGYSTGDATHRVERGAFAHRGHRSATCGGVVLCRRGRLHDPGARRGVDRDDAARDGAHRAERGRIDGDERVGVAAARGRHGRARRARQRGDPHLRRRGPLRRHVLRRPVGGGAGPRPRAVRAGPRSVPRGRGCCRTSPRRR